MGLSAAVVMTSPISLLIPFSVIGLFNEERVSEIPFFETLAFQCHRLANRDLRVLLEFGKRDADKASLGSNGVFGADDVLLTSSSSMSFSTIGLTRRTARRLFKHTRTTITQRTSAPSMVPTMMPTDEEDAVPAMPPMTGEDVVSVIDDEVNSAAMEPSNDDELDDVTVGSVIVVVAGAMT